MTKSTKSGSRWLSLAALAAVLAGTVLRLYLISGSQINSDEAIVGLMGMEILKGHHFAFYWGQSYMGSLEAYTAAALFYVLGVSVEVLKSVPLLFFMASAWLYYLFVDRTLGRKPALITVVFLFLSPPIFTIWTYSPRGGYMESLALGGAVLLLCQVIATHRSKNNWTWFVLLGLACGVGFWTHYFFIYYLVPVGIMVVLPGLFKEGRWKRLTAFSCSFLAGISPAIAFNIRHSFSSLKMMDIAGSTDFSESVFNLLVRELPLILGANKLVVKGPLPTPVSWVLLAMYAGAVLYYPFSAWRQSRSSQEKNLLPLQFLPPLILATTIAFFLGTGYGLFHTPRYLLPIYPIFVLFLAVSIHDLAKHMKWASVLATIVLLSIFTFQSWDYFFDHYIPTGMSQRKSMDDTVAYCRQNGIKTAYATHWVSYALTFLSKQDVIVANVDRARYEPFQHMVAESDHPSIISDAHGKKIHNTLKAIGLQHTVVNTGHYTIFDTPHFTPTIGKISHYEGLSLETTSGGVFSSFSQKGIISDSFQKEDMAVIFSVDEAGPVNGLVISPGSERLFYPQAFTVETSLDGQQWIPAAKVREYVGGIYYYDSFFYRKNGWISVYFPPRETRFIRLTLMKSSTDRHLAIDSAWASVPLTGRTHISFQVPSEDFFARSR